MNSMISTVNDLRIGEVFSPLAAPHLAMALLSANALPVPDGTKDIWAVVVDTADTPAALGARPGQLRKLPRSEPVQRLHLRQPALYEAR